MSTREERLENVNKIIQEIANRGRKFFYSDYTHRPSQFKFEGDKRKRLWFVDCRCGKVNPYPSNWRKDYNFTGGGTLWAMVHDFREYILTGKYTNGNNGYGGLYADAWGYPEEDLAAIRSLAKELGYLK